MQRPEAQSMLQASCQTAAASKILLGQEMRLERQAAARTQMVTCAYLFFFIDRMCPSLSAIKFVCGNPNP